MPVPPVTRNGIRAAMIDASSRAAPGSNVPHAMSSSTVNVCRRNVRSDRYGPSRPIGGSTACSRVPSGSCASTNGRRVVQPPPGAGREPLGEPAHLGRVAEPPGGPTQARAAVDPDLDAVDQHVGDGRVGEQRGEPAGTDHLADEPVGDLPQRALPEQGRARLGAHRRQHRPGVGSTLSTVIRSRTRSTNSSIGNVPSHRRLP